MAHKIGKARHLYKHKGKIYISHSEHNHLGMKLYDPDTGAISYIKKGFLVYVGRYNSPMQLMQFVADQRLDLAAKVTGLLHDTVEDT